MKISDGSYGEGEEEGEPDEFFDVLDILDGRAGSISEDEPSVTSSHKNEVLHASSEGQDVDGDADGHNMDSDEAGQLTSSDDEADVFALHNLGQFISDLDSSAKRKNLEGEGVAVAAHDVSRKKRRLLKEFNETCEENEFAASGELSMTNVPFYFILTLRLHRPGQTQSRRSSRSACRPVGQRGFSYKIDKSFNILEAQGAPCTIAAANPG